jgi:hypothetical protein
VGSTPTASTIIQQLAVSHWQLAFVSRDLAVT